MVFSRPFLQRLAEFLPEAGVGLGVLLLQAGHQVENALGQGAADLVHLGIVLQDFPRYVERKIVRIEYALDESQVERQKLFRLVHDEYSLHIEFQSPCAIPVPEIVRRVPGQEQQAGVFELAFDMVMTPVEGVFETVADVLVEFLVFLLLDFLARARP